MIKVFGLMPLASQAAGQAFDERWGAIGAPPAVEVERAVVSTVLKGEGVDALAGMLAFGERPPFAGIAELWFAGHAAFAAARPRLDAFYAEALGEALGAAGPTWLPTNEVVVIAGPEDGRERIKGVFFPHRLPGMPVAEFQRHWRTVHAPLVPRTPHLVRYVQDHTLPQAYEDGTEPFSDGVAELSWDSAELMAESLASDAVQVEQGEDVDNFVDRGRQVVVVVSERAV
jgi:uncharacterized protein (TIGR02118 family)